MTPDHYSYYIATRAVLDEGLEPWPKLTGGKGLHLMAPLDATIDHDRARAYAKQIAQRLAQPHWTRTRSLSAGKTRRAVEGN